MTLTHHTSIVNGLTRRPIALACLLATAACAPDSEPPPEPVPAITPSPAMEEPVTPTAMPVEPSPTSTPIVIASDPPAPPPEIDAALLGLVGRAGRPDAALIEQDGSQEIFRQGDPVFELGRLREIHANGVTIDGPKGSIELALAEPVASEAPRRRDATVVEVSPPAAPPRAIYESIQRSEARIALANLEILLEEAGARRVPIAGRHGVELAAVSSDGFFSKLGLKSKDILQTLNGVPIADAANVPNLASAANERELRVQFTRDGVGLTLRRRLR